MEIGIFHAVENYVLVTKDTPEALRQNCTPL